jgi:hypothetical protein
MLVSDLGILIRLYGLGKKYKKKFISIRSICKEIGIVESGQNFSKIRDWIEAGVLMINGDGEGYRINCDRIWEMLRKDDREIIIEIVSDQKVVF